MVNSGKQAVGIEGKTPFLLATSIQESCYVRTIPLLEH
jgi:hypothetical protein